jgi:hypothetical protein
MREVLYPDGFPAPMYGRKTRDNNNAQAGKNCLNEDPQRRVLWLRDEELKLFSKRDKALSWEHFT